MRDGIGSIYDGICNHAVPVADLRTLSVLPADASAEELCSVMRRDGGLVIKGVYTADLVASWRELTEAGLAKLLPHIPWTGRPRVLHFDGLEGHAILHSEHRADIWPWDAVVTDLRDGDCAAPRPLRRLLDDAADCSIVRKSVGVLPIGADCRTFGRWHRDSAALFRYRSSDPVAQDEMNTKRTPDFYFTSFIPLHPMAAGSGATECVLGSHRMSVAEAGGPDARFACAECEPGDIVVINGKLIHRGTHNPSQHRRDLLYLVWTASWFDEETA